MRHWFKDAHFRLLLKNSGYLAASKAVGAVAGLVTLALAGRTLGVSQFGMLVLVVSYAQAVGGIAKFNSWQVVVVYGSRALEHGDTATFQRATSFGLGLDLFSGAIAMVGSMLLLPFVGKLFGIPDQYVLYALLYCLLVPTMGSAMTGVLRAFDRFDFLSWQGTIQPNLRALLTVIAWWQSWGFTAFFVIWFVTELIAAIVSGVFGIRELKRRGLLGAIRPSLSARGLKGGWRFAINVNLNSSVSMTWGPLSRLLIGGVLSASSAGLYRVASSIADAVQRPTILLTKAFYPQVQRLDPKSREPWRLLFRVTAFAGLIGVLLILLSILFGQWLLRTAFGAEFTGAYGALVVLLAASLIGLVSFPMPALLDSMRRINIPLIANVAGAVIYLSIFYPLIGHFGLVGAGWAFVGGKLVVAAIMTAVLASEYRRLDQPRT